MKINGYTPLNNVLKAYNQNKTDKTMVKDKKSVTQEDSVQLSGEAKFKKEIESTLRELPEVREELVSKIKRDINSGAYKIDSDKIAAEIIKERLLDEKI
ncbi:flagellar biosynthesis anti-sigma factor FlgM [Desulforamulus aquiferis]|uniref:Negative regulator of flagellin synthesis n=1 Tax=Desulforamulus aquiferis TaxID=1397668 RepID=A0AAW7ZGL6_9FIRM|nr:flagellar biosynthesis anti-sigma factor FlgM [Desulforamulus aquiferis]MDO7788339.1 flagellar biosynthesis anti-sigma factor FlgM [Desulforamulus aquiferis]RYD06289.1 hypothetical protein N752_05195 [Desulforamulus aquiferis]